MRNRYFACRLIVAEVLSAAREAAGISQRELSRRLKRPYNYVYLVERGDRRMEFCELMEWVRAVGADLVEIVKSIMERARQRRKRAKG